MDVAIVNLILATPNIRPGLILERVRPIASAELEEINIVELGNALADRGHDVTLYVADAFLEDGDVRIRDRFEIRGVPTNLRRLFHPALLPLTPSLPEAIMKDGADVIQSSEFHHPGTYFASRAATSAGIPLIIWQEIYHRMRAPGSWYEYGYEATAGRAVQRTAPRFVPRTTKAKEYLMRLGVPPGRIALWVPTGIDTDFFRPRQSHLKPTDFGFGEESQVILMVSRLNPDKQVDLAIRSVALLRNRGKDIGLVIRGSGPEGPNLQTLAERLQIADRVHFFPRVSRQELVELYNAADVFLVTSHGDLELLPFALLQASACALPIVTVPAGCLEDVVRHGVNGVVVRSETPEMVAEGLLLALSNEETRSSMARESRRRAEQLFDIRVVAKNLEGVYREALGAR